MYGREFANNVQNFVANRTRYIYIRKYAFTNNVQDRVENIIGHIYL
jgi:hypothetical protein